MKKLGLLGLFVVCFSLIPFLFVGCSAENKLNEYRISIEFDDNEKSLVCNQDLDYFNNTSNALNEISFFLYPNSFQEGRKVVSKSYFDRTYPNGSSFGKIEFDNIEVDGKANDYEIVGNEKNILRIKLKEDLFPDEKVSISMSYTVFLANINHRLGYGNNTVNVGNFFPIVCVYEDKKGFIENDFSLNGDPFYSDNANFEVKIICNKKYNVATSGLYTEKIGEEQKIIEAKAENVRDFCFVLSEKFERLSTKVEGVEINYYFYDDEFAKEHLETSVKAVKTYNKLFGEYPYKQLSVVKSNFCFGGMEYPNLVLISDAISDNETYNYVIAHEIAHQWWYSLVGNDEFNEPWLDEGLTEFSTALFFENNNEYNIDYKMLMDSAKESYKSFVSIYKKINGTVDESMNRNLNQFNTEPEYTNCIYTKGMLLFDNLRQTMGDKKFFKCLKSYFADNIYKNVTSERFMDSFSRTSHINIREFVEAWLNGKVVFQ